MLCPAGRDPPQGRAVARNPDCAFDVFGGIGFERPRPNEQTRVVGDSSGLPSHGLRLLGRCLRLLAHYSWVYTALRNFKTRLCCAGAVAQYTGLSTSGVCAGWWRC